MLKLLEQKIKYIELVIQQLFLELTAVQNKMPDVSNLVKKTDHDTKISEIEKEVTDHDHDKYITSSEFSKLATENFVVILTQADFVTKADFEP